MTNKEILEQASHFLEMHYDVRFPNGYSKVTSYKGFGSGVQFFTIGLISEQRDCSSNIRDNDIGFGKFILKMDEKGQLVLEKNFHALTCNPTEKHYALSHQKVPFRKIRAKNYHDLIEKFDKYLDKFASLINEKKEANEIYNQSKYDEKYFQFN